jgi:hypothetical protein
MTTSAAGSNNAIGNARVVKKPKAKTEAKQKASEVKANKAQVKARAGVHQARTTKA